MLVSIFRKFYWFLLKGNWLRFLVKLPNWMGKKMRFRANNGAICEKLTPIEPIILQGLPISKKFKNGCN